MSTMTETKTDRERIAVVFSALNGLGVVARADWQCCATCGSVALQQEGAENYVFFHEQASEYSFNENGDLTDKLYLQHSGETAARMALVAFRAAGFTCEWNGSDGRCIEVSA